MVETSEIPEEIQDSENDKEKITPEKTPRLFNRRTILKGLFFGGLAAAAPSLVRASESLPAGETPTPPEPVAASETITTPELEAQFTNRQFIMDFAPAFEQDVIDFDHHSPVNLVAEYPNDSGTWARELVAHSDMNWDELPEDLKQNISMAIGMFDEKYSRHAIDVSDAATATHELTLGTEKSLYDLYPLQRTARLASPDYQDSLGNKGLQIEFSADEIIAAAKPRPEKVINISSQPGLLTFINEGVVEAVPKEIVDANTVFPITVDGEQLYIIDEFSIRNYEVLQNKPQTESENGIISHTSSNSIYIDRIIENGTERWVRTDTGEAVSLLNQDEARVHLEKVWAENIQRVETPASELEWQAPYVSEQAVRNFKEALRTARECPDKLWIYSAGNENEEIGQLKAQVIADGEEIPQNILFVAQLKPMSYTDNGELRPVEPTHHVWGADLYINNYDYNVEKDGSSFSAPIVSSIAENLAEQGLNPIQIKNKLLELADVYEVIGSHIIKVNTDSGVSYNRVSSFKTEKIPVLDRQRVMSELNPQGWANQFGRG